MSESSEATPARLAVPADAGRLGALLHEFNVEFDTASPGPPAIEHRLAELLVTDHTFAVVSGNPIVAVGLVTLRTNVWFAQPVALLDELYVVPHLRGRGLGTALISFMERTCRERGIEQIEINVDEGDHDARRFYERHGYVCGEGPGALALFYERNVGEGSGQL